MRAAMDFKHQRVFLRGVEAGRGDVPPLDFGAVEAGIVDNLMDLAERPVGEDVLIERGQPSRAVAAAHGEICGALAGTCGEGERAVCRDVVSAACVGSAERGAAKPLDHRRNAPVETHAPDLLDAAIVVGEVNRAIAAPADIADLAVEGLGEVLRAAAVGVLHADVDLPHRALHIGHADEGHARPVGRDLRIALRAAARCELAQGAVRDIDRVDVTLDCLQFPALVAIGGEVDALPVAAPGQRPLVIKAAFRKLARSAAACRHDEDMAEGRIGEARAVAAELGVVDHLDRLGPLRALGLLGHLGEGLGLGVDIGGEGDPPAVGRPGEAARAIGEAGDLLDLPAVHPAGEDRRASVLVAPGIGDAPAIG